LIPKITTTGLAQPTHYTKEHPMTTTAAPQGMTKAQLNDFYGLEALYTPEEKLIRDSVQEFVKGEILPDIGEWWQDGYFPPELPKKFGDLGVLGVTLPEKYGGLGASYTAYGLINREIEYGDSGMRSFVSVQSSLVMYPIFTYGSEDLKMKWLPRLAKKGRQQLCHQWCKTLDYQWFTCRCCNHLGKERRRWQGSRLCNRHNYAWL